jgi:hypothetical protein
MGAVEVNWTPATPTLSAALAVTVIVPETVASADGAVTETVGGVVSGRQCAPEATRDVIEPGRYACCR